MPWDEPGRAPGTARPASRLPGPPPALAQLPVVLRVPRYAGGGTLRSVPDPRNRAGRAAGKVLAVVVLAASVVFLLRWHAWLVSPEPLPRPAAASEEVQTLPPLRPASGRIVPAQVPGNEPAAAAAGTARLAPQIVPLETGGVP